MAGKKAQPRAKMGKKDKRALDLRKRAVWDVKPVTRVVESRKLYRRHRKEDHDV
ncbi:MAG TPA: hypothetical protein VLA21_01770 [Candidatus Limnocylindria bacterium]|nr:hypothetical protein [Candidatus Limnocylindria bacterium]